MLLRSRGPMLVRADTSLGSYNFKRAVGDALRKRGKWRCVRNEAAVFVPRRAGQRCLSLVRERLEWQSAPPPRFEHATRLDFRPLPVRHRTSVRGSIGICQVSRNPGQISAPRIKDRVYDK